MKKVFGILLIAFFAVTFLSACGSRKDACPNNFGLHSVEADSQSV